MTDQIYAPLQLYTTKELAALYRISTKTLHRWLQPHQAMIGPRPGHLFSIFQVETIFRIFGWPEVKNR